MTTKGKAPKTGRPKKVNVHDHDKRRKSVFYMASCEIHGLPVDGTGRKWVKTAVPYTRAEKMAGCPKCASASSLYPGYHIQGGG